MIPDNVSVMVLQQLRTSGTSQPVLAIGHFSGSKFFAAKRLRFSRSIRWTNAGQAMQGSATMTTPRPPGAKLETTLVKIWVLTEEQPRSIPLPAGHLTLQACSVCEMRCRSTTAPRSTGRGRLEMQSASWQEESTHNLSVNTLPRLIATLDI